jgi:hypothetical protein
MLLREIITLSYANYIKPINTLCEQSAELLIVKVDGTHNYY